MSQAFRFRQGENWYIIRLSHGSGAYWRDRLAFEMLTAQQGLPIPKVYWIDKGHGVAFAISECLPGIILARQPEDKVRHLLPSILVQLRRLQRAEPANPGRFGSFGPDQIAPGRDWRMGLEVFFSEPESGYWKGWPSLFNHDWFEANTFWAMHERMLDLARTAPSKAYVVHGDFHCGNLLGDGDTITGLIDWAQMLFGDWIFDVATFQFWSPQFDLARLVFERGEEYGFDLSYFQERFWCSCYAVGLDALRFMAKIGDEASGRKVAEQLREMEHASWACF